MSSSSTERSALAAWLATESDLALLMAHDLRNPIAALMANLSYLELSVSPEDKEALDALGDMRHACDQMLRTVENQVAIARLEASVDNADRSRTEVALGDLVQQSVHRFRSLLREAGIEVTVSDESHGASMAGDPILLETMGDNLLSSVLQHVTRGGRARLAITADDAHVALTLEDDGTPFGPPDRDFSREGQVAMKSHSDTRYTRGLGLYVIGLVVRANGGRIDTKGSGKAAHVRIEFPRAAPSAV
jgi:signal transduction histidine kinase